MESFLKKLWFCSHFKGAILKVSTAVLDSVSAAGRQATSPLTVVILMD